MNTAQSVEQTLSVEQKCQLGRLAAKQFLAITKNWKLTDEQRRIVAGAATRTTIATWKKRVANKEELQLGRDTYERLICIIEIENALQEKVKTEGINYSELLHQHIDAFNNYTIIENMLNGKVIDLYNTKAYLESNNPLKILH
jgi:hypothetical protein